jgi:DnaJ-class molecular chaperone
MYKDLNLKEGASLSEIKAAYRIMAKTYHPDSLAAGENGNPEKFRRAYEAYKSLLRNAINGNVETVLNENGNREDLTPYVFSTEKTKGLDIYYDLVLEKPGSLKEIKISVPVVRREACPRCLGQGMTLTRKGNGYVYKPKTCDRCEGKGFTEEERQVVIILTPEMLDTGKVRLRNVGGYLPKEGKRGDLILNLEYVERLPENN